MRFTVNHPIVFIHGSGDSARIWRLQVEGLGKDHFVYAIDLPGHGERADTLPASVTVLDYAKAAREIMQNELDLNHPIIAGHSLGGAVALTMALEYGSELGGLILMGTGARLRVHPSLLEAAQATPQQAKNQLTELAVTQGNDGTLPQTLQNEQATPGPKMLYRDLAACNAFDCMARMHEISLPTLVICGADDGLTPVKYSQFLHDRLGNSTLCIIPGAGHYVMREQAEHVNQAITEWMEKI
jgi:pimeloyl-ACP methyl ester carboxylesterase